MIRKCSSVLIALLFVSASYGADNCFDHSIWDNILKANVADGYVDYAGVRINKGGTLYEYLTFIELKDVKGCGEPGKKAFWINAYNANVFRLVTENPSMESIKGPNGVYGKRFEAANAQLTLKRIENRIFRRREDKGGPYPGLSLKAVDPRIHFAIVNGAVGAPKLKPNAWTGDTVEQNLIAAAREFANDPTKIRIEEGQLVMPAFLKWYAKDFENYGGVAKFLIGMTDAALRADAEEIDSKLETDFPEAVRFVFDWTLNDVKNK